MSPLDSAWSIIPILIHFNGHLVDFETFGKMLIAPEWNELASSALCRSKEENFFYRMAILEVKIE
jgi:hypothetical protein